MKKIVIEIIPHSAHHYETVGDYYPIEGEEDSWVIRVSESGNNMTNMLVAIHELVELVLTQHKGITEESITEFDEQYESERAAGLHEETEEPGFDPAAPYMIEHTVATSVEMQVCAAAGMSWKEHEDNIYAL